MGLIKEPIDVDFSNKSEPWTEKELLAFRKIIQESRAKSKNQDLRFKKMTSSTKA
ncbi:MAG: hypothetical protein RIQ70_1034 [Bacteroidota bacterium]|jgi:hypothetical protein